MTPEDALTILDNTVATASGTREAHAQLQAAILVLRVVIDQNGSELDAKVDEHGDVQL